MVIIVSVTRSELIRYNYVYSSRGKDPNPKQVTGPHLAYSSTLFSSRY